MLLRLKVFRFCLIEISVCGCVAITYLKIVNAAFLLQLNLLVDQTLHISIGAPHVMHYSLFSCVG